MIKKLNVLIVLLCAFILLPNTIKASTSLNLKETLADEEIEEAFDNYKETDNQITIYLFRGKGCGYCRAFLTFLNNITDEYGKYFKLVSYEVWNNQENNTLMSEVSTFLGQQAGGVPYIVIGDKVFAGYAASYDDGIKQAITDLYNTKKKDRYDVFSEMKKNNKKINIDINSVIFPLIFTIISTIIIISYINLKYKELKLEISKISIVKENIKIDNKDTKKKKK